MSAMDKVECQTEIEKVWKELEAVSVHAIVYRPPEMVALGSKP